MGPLAKEWLLQDLLNYILDTSTLPKLLKQSQVIAIKKPGKVGDEAAHYRPIYLLPNVFKLLKHLVLLRIGTEVDVATPWRFQTRKVVHRSNTYVDSWHPNEIGKWVSRLWIFLPLM